MHRNKFLAEAEQIETLSPYFRILSPIYFAFFFFLQLHKLNSQNMLFIVFSPAFQINTKITKQQFKSIYLTLNIF